MTWLRKPKCTKDCKANYYSSDSTTQMGFGLLQQIILGFSIFDDLAPVSQF